GIRYVDPRERIARILLMEQRGCSGKPKAKAEVTRLARSDGLEQLPHAGLHAVGRLDARRPAACDDDVLAAPAGRKRCQHEQRRRAFALVPLLFDLRPRLREPAMETLDAHVQLILRKALTVHLDAGEEDGV